MHFGQTRGHWGYSWQQGQAQDACAGTAASISSAWASSRSPTSTCLLAASVAAQLWRVGEPLVTHPGVLRILYHYLQKVPRWLDPGKTNAFTSMFTAKIICSALNKRNVSPTVLNPGITLLTKPTTLKGSFMWLLLWWPMCQGFTRAAYPLIKQNQWIYADSFRCCGNLSNLSPAYVACCFLP